MALQIFRQTLMVIWSEAWFLPCPFLSASPSPAEQGRRGRERPPNFAHCPGAAAAAAGDAHAVDRHQCEDERG
jgi:hypothetical protein